MHHYSKKSNKFCILSTLHAIEITNLISWPKFNIQAVATINEGIPNYVCTNAQLTDSKRTEHYFVIEM